ncbi:hypothetical protein GTW71_07800, partial [Streptomyces sp. SID6041]|nr:hypothetical protein [Streptomyces sp. SID6041]
MGATRLVRPSQRARPMALASAVATLLAALFFCLGAGPGPGDHHTDAGPRADAAPRAAGGTPDVGTPAVARALGGAAVEYVCPYDRGGCSLFPSLSPAVLSA